MSDRPDELVDGVTAINGVDGDVAGTVVQAGAIYGDVHFHPTTRQPVVTLPHRSLPRQFGLLPPQAGAFQHRAVATDLAATLAPVAGADSEFGAEIASEFDTAVLVGLGGIGKTQLAAEYARRAAGSGAVDLLVWITATTRERAVDAYAGVADEILGPVGDDVSPDDRAASLLAWLASTTNRWLVVLDDLRAPRDLRGLWPPRTATGRTVVTTRRRDAALEANGRRVIEVDLFTADESADYLRRKLATQASLADGAEELAAALGHLPLALAQAAAFLADRQLSCADYQRRFADRRRSLCELAPDELPDEHRYVLAATWSLSVELASALAPTGLAGPLLDISAVLDANGIPEEVFSTPVVLARLTECTGRPIDADTARDGLSCLRRLSLVTRDTAAVRPELGMHELVQRATWDQLSQDQQLTVARLAADALLEIWPDSERDAERMTTLRANVAALRESTGELVWQAGGHQVFLTAGDSVGHSGRVAAARDYFRALLEVVVPLLGPTAPMVLLVRSSLAFWQAEAGDRVGADVAFVSLLADQIRLLGPDDPRTLTTRSNIAFNQGITGDATGAAAAFRALFADRLRVLGPDHPATLTARSNIGFWLGEAGNKAGAARVFKDVVADRLRVLGPDHPATLRARSHLARLAGELDQPRPAADELAAVLAAQTSILGADHPDVLVTRGSLAHVLGTAGEVDAAVTRYDALARDQERILGTDHPETLRSRERRAHWRAVGADRSV